MRLEKPGLQINMPNSKDTTLVVGVNSILSESDPDVEANTFSLTNQGFSAVIDSTFPFLLLPDDVCDEFASLYGLEFDNTNKLYTVNASSHETNKRKNATVHFKISASPDDTVEFTSIVLPYSAFDLVAEFPLFTSPNETATAYFPIKKSDTGIYVLGRAFLQEAYVIVDYERSNFTVAPAAFPNPTQQDLVPIFNKTYTPSTSKPESESELSAGAIAGIVVGIVVAFIVAGIGAFLFWRKRKATKEKTMEDEKPSEIDTTFAGAEVKHRRVSELTGSEAPQSPKGSSGYYYADHKAVPGISEMSPESTPAELYSPPPDSRDTLDYFSPGRMRRRGATRDRDPSGNNTPRTPIAELAGEDVKPQSPEKQHDCISPIQKPPHNRSPSNTSLSTNIDEVLANKQTNEPKTSTEEISSLVAPGDHPTCAQGIDEAKAGAQPGNSEQANIPTLERRPSHTRGLSETTVQSDSTAVSQPTPEELESWARSVDDGTTRPMSP